MKPSTRFLLFLCIWLQGDRTAVFASSQNGSIVYQKCSQLLPAGLVISGLAHHCIFIEPAADLPVEKDLLVFEEEDNEDEHTRKHKSTTEPFSIFFCSLTSTPPGSKLIHVFSFSSYKYNTGDCKYIAYRVLRI